MASSRASTYDSISGSGLRAFDLVRFFVRARRVIARRGCVVVWRDSSDKKTPRKEAFRISLTFSRAPMEFIFLYHIDASRECVARVNNAKYMFSIL
jgi:hypothetical protein